MKFGVETEFESQISSSRSSRAIPLRCWCFAWRGCWELSLRRGWGSELVFVDFESFWSEFDGFRSIFAGLRSI